MNNDLNGKLAYGKLELYKKMTWYPADNIDKTPCEQFKANLESGLFAVITSAKTLEIFDFVAVLPHEQYIHFNVALVHREAIKALAFAYLAREVKY